MQPNIRQVAGALLLVTPSLAWASDFVVMNILIACLVIVGTNITLGFFASRAVSSKGRSSLLPYLLGIGFFTAIGTGITLDEAEHMADTDVIGTLLFVLVPSAIAAIVSLLTTAGNEPE